MPIRELQHWIQMKCFAALVEVLVLLGFALTHFSPHVDSPWTAVGFGVCAVIVTLIHPFLQLLFHAAVLCAGTVHCVPVLWSCCPQLQWVMQVWSVLTIISSFLKTLWSLVYVATVGHGAGATVSSWYLCSAGSSISKSLTLQHFTTLCNLQSEFMKNSSVTPQETHIQAFLYLGKYWSWSFQTFSVNDSSNCH